MDGEEATAPEDLSKWTVDDVCSFVGGLSGCGEYAPVRGVGGHLPEMVPSASPRPSPSPLLNSVWGGGGCCCMLPPALCRVSASASDTGTYTLNTQTFLPFASFSGTLCQQLPLALLSLESLEATPDTQYLVGWRDSAGRAGTGPSTQARTSARPQVFREQGIDGETLPLLTEEHLLTTMGLKLGPALKIRAQVSASWGQQSPHNGGSALRLFVAAGQQPRRPPPPRPISPQVAKRLGRVFYMASFPVALPLQPPTLRAPERELTSGEQALSPALAPSPYGGGHPPAGRASPKQENGTVALLPGPADPSQPLC